ncbi:hypothetical protein ACP4OV_008662 [Aristida adscensionis]
MEMEHPAAPEGVASRAQAGGAASSAIGKYEELCSLGEGSFGAVVKARHRLTGEVVAIKRLIPKPDPDSDDGPTPEDELLWEARLHHHCAGLPFVIGFHGLLRDPATDGLCLVMECAAASLHDVLRAHHRRRPGEPLPEPTVKSVMHQLLTAAKAMHARHVVHRDIKPRNVLVGGGEDGDHRVLKICDFGLAMSLAEPPPHQQKVLCDMQ